MWSRLHRYCCPLCCSSVQLPAVVCRVNNICMIAILQSKRINEVIWLVYKKLKPDAIYMINCPCTNFWEIVQFNNVKVMKTWLHAVVWMRYDAALPYQIFDFSLQARCVNRKFDTVSEITTFVRMVELALIWTQITGKTIDKSVI